MRSDTIVGAGRPRFLKPGEKYHWVREWEAEGLLPKRWAVASEPVVVETYNHDWQRDHPWEGCMTMSLVSPGPIDPEK